MADIVLSIAPIFLIIVLGHLLRRGGIPNVDFWNLNDKLVYWVLFPCLLFHKTATIELAPELMGSLAVAVLGGFTCAAITGLGLAKVFGCSNTAASSVLQGAARHNTFIALAVAERIYGADGLATAALITAFLIPITNMSIVPAMVILHGERKGQGLIGPILRDLSRNPLIIAVALGLGFNATGFDPIPVVHEMTRVIGAAALPIVLMCVGANIRLRAMQASTWPLIASLAGKMVVFPVAIVALGIAIGLPASDIMIALLFGAAPTAAASYTLARQLGGDAPLMASIVTIQTGLAFLTLPLTVITARAFLF